MKKPLEVRLQYEFHANRAETSQSGADVAHPLFDLLTLLEQHGSIRQASIHTGRSYRHMWGELKHWETTLGQPLVLWVQGQRAQLTPFAQRLMWAERQARTRMRPHLEALRSELRRVLNDAGDERHIVLSVHASHDLELPRLRELAESSLLHIDLKFSSSVDALRAVNERRCDVAGFHVPRLPDGSTVFSQALRPWLKPGTHKLIGSHSRRQGLMCRHDLHKNGLTAQHLTLRDVVNQRMRFAMRQPGSSTRLLLEELLQRESLSIAALTVDTDSVELTHVAVAASVASGRTDVALGIEAAAFEHGLTFTPLSDEDYFLVCLKDHLDTPGVQALRALLGSPSWAISLSSMPGYSPHECGRVLSLTKALPWWQFSRRKSSRRVQPA